MSRQLREILKVTFLWHPVYRITGQNTDRAVIERLTRDDSIRVKRGPRFLHHLYSAQHHHRHLCIQLFAITFTFIIFTIIIFNIIIIMFTTSLLSSPLGVIVMFGGNHCRFQWFLGQAAFEFDSFQQWLSTIWSWCNDAMVTYHHYSLSNILMLLPSIVVIC